MIILPMFSVVHKQRRKVITFIESIFQNKRNRYFAGIIIDVCLLTIIIILAPRPINKVIIPLISPITSIQPIANANILNKGTHEIYGFAPYWVFDKVQKNIDFNILTTLSYFGITVADSGDLDTNDPGYITFMSDKATHLFTLAHSNNTRVVVTLTQMDNTAIENFLDNQNAQESRIHHDIPGSQVTVAVYATSAKEIQLYDLSSLGKEADNIFMMAYDFSVPGSDNATPTAPLYGYKKGKYWYDVATAVNDFLTLVPANKLILGVPYYGYDWPVYQPKVDALTRPYYSWQGSPTTQTYASAQENIQSDKAGTDGYLTGWDNDGKVGWRAYFVAATGTWRMVFLDDPRSLGLKYDFAIQNNLAGVGMWALGYDDGRKDLWQVLKEKFGVKDVATNRQTRQV